MSNLPVNLEMSGFLYLIKTYEMLTGLVQSRIRQDECSLQIEWTYPDGTWAGVSTYDLPIQQAVERLEAEVEAERTHLGEGYPMWISRYPRIERGARAR